MSKGYFYKDSERHRNPVYDQLYMTQPYQQSGLAPSMKEPQADRVSLYARPVLKTDLCLLTGIEARHTIFYGHE